MAKIDWEKFRGRTTFVLGTDKNAGKTTFLTNALAELRRQGLTPAYLSSGVDGEAHDLLTGAPKPLVIAEPGDVLVTVDSALDASTARFEVIEALGETTVLGGLVVARALCGGQVELIGPATNRGLARALERLRKAEGADAVLVDGAVDRVTQVSSSERAGYVLVMRAGPSTLGRCARRVKLELLFERIPAAGAAETDVASPGIVALEGALTGGRLETVPPEYGTLVVEDFTRVFLDYPEMAALCGSKRVLFRRSYEALYFVVNLESVTREEFLRELGEGPATDRLLFDPYPLGGLTERDRP